MTQYEDWIGKQQTKQEVLEERHAHMLAVTLGLPVPQTGEPLPMPWHWGWFNDVKPAGELGRDGHPAKGGFLPPVPLPRRMWAGGSLKMHKPLLVGRQVSRVSTIENIEEKNGRSGQLFIVRLRHEIFDREERCIEEIQNLVYREDPGRDAPEPARIAPPTDAVIQRKFVPDPVLMFRYSALTFNGHRIHYDVDYARDVEGYRDLVFHAPLTASFLYALAQEMVARPLAHFEYRATSPLFCNEPVILCGKQQGDEIVVWAENEAGSQAMIAKGQPSGAVKSP